MSFRVALCACIALLVGTTCAQRPPAPATDPLAARVLVVANTLERQSVALARFYMEQRRIPQANYLGVSMRLEEDVPLQEYKDLERQVRRAVDRLQGRIDYIVLMKGIPLRIRQGGYSVDGHLVAMDLDIKPIEKPEPEAIRRSANPFFMSRQPFRRDQFRMFLVTRLDGYTFADARRLVTHSMAAKPAQGPFFFDSNGRNDPPRTGWGVMDTQLRAAAQRVRNLGFESILEETRAFVAPERPVMGYVSWGSNDARFSKEAYRKVRFLPGAISETFVSTSARTFRRTEQGQSLIADLVQQGVTGVKGYVSEPFTFALARPEILFDRYLAGMNLAEAFYSASPVIKWKCLVLGDPLCRPFASRRR